MNDKRRKFIDAQYVKLDQFVDDVAHQRFPVNQEIQLAVRRYQEDRANDLYEFRTDKLDRFFHFLSYVKLLQDNKYVVFNPEPWQVFYFANIYGFYHAGTDDRRFTVSMLSIARKNGKTTIGAIQTLYHLTRDGNIDAQVYFISQTRELATNGLKIAKNIVKNSPAIKNRVRNMKYVIEYENDETTNFMKAMTGDAEGLNSIRPAFGLIDESHLMMDSDLVDMFKSGQVGVNNPLMSIITTRGNNTTGWYQYEYEQYLKKVLRKESTDESTFIMLFGLDSEEEVQDTNMWVKANPNLLNPKILKLKQLTDPYETKRYRLSGLRNFVIFNLNTWWEKGGGDFIPKDVLDKVWVDELLEELIAGEECYMGIDLSSTKDITSVSLLFPPSANHDEYMVKNWNIKTNSVEKRVRANGLDLSEYIDKGMIIELDKPIIDYNFLFNLIEEISERYNVRAIGHDSYNTALLVPRVRDDLGLDCRSVPQTPPRLNFPTKFIEKLIYDEHVTIDNLVNKWMFGNVKLFIDGNNNYKAMKNKSLDSIDGVVSIVNALAVYIEDIGEEQLNYVATAV